MYFDKNPTKKLTWAKRYSQVQCQIIIPYSNEKWNKSLQFLIYMILHIIKNALNTYPEFKCSHEAIHCSEQMKKEKEEKKNEDLVYSIQTKSKFQWYICNNITARNLLNITNISLDHFNLFCAVLMNSLHAWLSILWVWHED